MPLTLKLRDSLDLPLDVEALQLPRVRELSAAEVARMPILQGNRQIACGEFFDVQGSAAEDNIQQWEGHCERVQYIGAHLDGGTVRVEGHAGRHLGMQMRGGTIDVQGNVGDWAGAEMKGGRLQVRGNAGNCLGAAYRGGRRGMTGGEILVHGTAGDEIGHTMRRGLIAVAGHSGDSAGFNMIAGSIFLWGETGRHHGTGMKRGTLLLMHPREDNPLPPTFEYATTQSFSFLTNYHRHLEAAGFPIPDAIEGTAFDRYCGDKLTLGFGEILVPHANSHEHAVSGERQSPA